MAHLIQHSRDILSCKDIYFYFFSCDAFSLSSYFSLGGEKRIEMSRGQTNPAGNGLLFVEFFKLSSSDFFSPKMCFLFKGY